MIKLQVAPSHFDAEFPMTPRSQFYCVLLVSTIALRAEYKTATFAPSTWLAGPAHLVTAVEFLAIQTEVE